jgi:hypothetical protein
MGLAANPRWVKDSRRRISMINLDDVSYSDNHLYRARFGWIPDESFIVLNGTDRPRWFHGWFYRERDGAFLGCMYVPAICVEVERLEGFPEYFVPNASIEESPISTKYNVQPGAPQRVRRHDWLVNR